ncbi:MAG: porin [Rhodoferax sp.]|nr:porin [Rhodoferax sp.]
MKKTLIALAVLAASGASFAQATITGKYTFGYVQTGGGGVATKSGIGTDTAAIKVAASEDLGGGLKASAQVTLGGMMRDGAGTGEDATVNLSGGFGSLTMGTVESGNGLLAIGSSGASGFGVDGKVISGSSNIDLISYSLPLGNGLSFGLSYVDRGPAAAAGATAAGVGTGLGVGSAGATGGQTSYTAGVTYAAGPLAAKLDFTNWNRFNDTDVTQFVTGAGVVSGGVAAANKNRFRLSAGYDMGAVRLSGGYSSLTADSVATGAVTATETLIGVKVPVGAVTFGLDVAASQHLERPTAPH